MTIISALILIAGFSISLLQIPRTGLRSVLAPFRTKALLAYFHVLPSWTYPYFDLLNSVEEQTGTYLRLRANTAITALSSALFVRLLLGQLVPASATVLILLSGTGFICLTYLERSYLRPILQRTQALIQVKVSRPLNCAIGKEVVSSKCLRDSNLNTLEALIAAPNTMASIACNQVLPFMGDMIAAFVMLLIFVLVTGEAYLFVLGIYSFYVLAELLLAYSRERLTQTSDQRLSQAVFKSLRRHPNDYLSSGLTEIVLKHLKDHKRSQSDRKFEEELSLNRERLGGEVANDLVIIGILLILFAQFSVSPVQSGELVAGLLVLFRLTGLTRKAIRKYFKAKIAAKANRGLEDGVLRVLKRSNSSEELTPGRRNIAKSVQNQLEIQFSRGVIDLRSQAFPSSRGQLRSIDLHQTGRGCIGVTGDSGAGKTTLLRALTSIYELQRGELRLNSLNIKQYSHAEISSRVVMINCDSFLLPSNICTSLGNHLWGSNIKQNLLRASGQNTMISSHQVGDSWVQRLLDWLFHQETRLICLDQPESWPQSVKNKMPEDWLECLCRYNLVVLASKDLNLLKRCKTVYVMQAGLLKEITHSSKP